MTITNKRSNPVEFDPEKHVDTQIVRLHSRMGVRFVTGISLKPGDNVALVRTKANLNVAEWVRVGK